MRRPTACHGRLRSESSARLSSRCCIGPGLPLDAASGEFPSGETQHDYGILIRYSIEGSCPRYTSLVRAQDYRGHPGWEGVYYGDARK